jgi:hypothetical protein
MRWLKRGKKDRKQGKQRQPSTWTGTKTQSTSQFATHALPYACAASKFFSFSFWSSFTATI